jgi:hypothetical protein
MWLKRIWQGIVYIRTHLRTVLTVCVLLIVCIGITYVVTAFQSSKVSSQAIVKELRALSRYESVVYTVETIVDQGEKQDPLRQILFGDRILLIASGEVIAGLDLSMLSESSSRIEGTRIQLSLPPAQILVVRLDSEKTRVYDRQQGIFSAFSQQGKDTESDARLSAEQSIREAACRDKILEKAAENARKQLESLLSAMGFIQIEIVIPDSSC